VKVQVKKTRRARAQELQQLSRERKRLKQATMHHKEALLKGQKEEEAAAAAAAEEEEEEPEYRPTYNAYSIASQVSAPLPAAAMTTHRLPPPHCCA
jgi:hypothetical protein